MTVNPASRAMLASLNISVWTTERIDFDAENFMAANHAATPGMGRYQKKLILPEDIKPLKLIAGRARWVHYDFTMPWVHGGMRILPVPVFAEYDAQLAAIKKEFDAEVAAFVEGYPDLIRRAKKSLGKLFDEADYPDEEEVEWKFGWDNPVLPMPSPANLATELSPTRQAKLKRDIDRRLSSAIEDGTRHLFQRAEKVIGRMAEALTKFKTKPNHKGTMIEVGRFYPSLVTNISDTAALIDKMNIAGDVRLVKLTKTMVEKLTKHDATELKTDRDLRREIAKEAKAILGSMRGAT